MDGRIALRIPARLVADIAYLAEQEKKTPSEVIREAILAHLAKRAKK